MQVDNNLKSSEVNRVIETTYLFLKLPVNFTFALYDSENDCLLRKNFTTSLVFELETTMLNAPDFKE